MTKLPSTIDLRAELFEFTVPDIEAADTDGKKKLPSFTMAAYSGGPMQLGWSVYPTILNASGVRHAGKVPVLIEHGYAAASKARSALGHTTKVTTKGGRIAAEGVVSGVGEEVEHYMAMARNGFPFQASVGVTVDRDAVQFVAEGQTVKANGQTFKGPCYYAASGQLREISIVVLGADPETETRIAATKERTPVEPTSTETPPTAPAVLATIGPVETERARIREIVAAFAGLNADAERDQFIASGAPVAEANARALHLLRASRPSIPGGPTTIAASYSSPTPTAILAAGAARLLGAPEAAIAKSKLPVDVDVPESLYDLAQRCVRADGREITGGRDGMIRAAFSSDRFTGALASALSVIALDRFASSPEAALQICKPVSVSDFREQTLARLDGNFKFQEIANSGEIKHAVIDGKSTTFKLGTYGVLVQLTRQDVINDERGMLQQIPSELGAEAARTIGDKFAEALIAGSFFDNGNGNLLSGAGSALQLSQLTEAVRKLRVQTGKDGRALNLAPKYLLVPPALEATARQLLNSMELGRDDGGPTANPMQGIAQLLVDARLTATNWYVFSAPENGAAVLATLNGKAVPTIEAVDLPSDRLGVGWRGYHDFAIAMHEPRAAVRSIGA